MCLVCENVRKNVQYCMTNSENIVPPMPSDVLAIMFFLLWWFVLINSIFFRCLSSTSHLVIMNMRHHTSMKGVEEDWLPNWMYEDWKRTQCQHSYLTALLIFRHLFNPENLLTPEGIELRKIPFKKQSPRAFLITKVTRSLGHFPLLQNWQIN